jgi:arylsulfatase A-like enzyme
LVKVKYIIGVCLFTLTFSLQSQKPNVVFFLVDDMGWKDLGCYGSKYYETPNIDKLASEGILFRAAYASHPVCGPSRAGIITGKMPIRTGNVTVTGNLKPAEKTMAEAFKDQGYQTYFTGKWHLGMTDGRDPAGQGFDQVVGVNHAGQPGSYFYPYKDIGMDWVGRKRRVIPNRDVLGLDGGVEGEFLTDRLTNEAVKFIKKNKSNPFFLFFSHYAVHTPLQGKEEYIRHYEKKGNELETREVLIEVDDRAFSRKRQTNPVYAANIQSLDESVGQIMETLSELGLDQNTIIIFTSDNGGLSTTRGGNPQMPTSNLPLRFGKGWMYEGGIRVPGIVKFPKKIKAGSISDKVVCGYDFFPTLLSLADLPLLPEFHEDGLDIFYKSKNKNFSKREMYWHYPLKHVSGHDPSSMMRKGKYKLILDLNSDTAKLFNVEKDLEENHDLSDRKERLAKKMKSNLVSFIDKFKS